ncbi:hypothetical protein KUTeg_009022 [Tegillarca granosa]|uniref:Uncharacterized protein n=1 Tax=Tegillarca granosa TaxID=220873 RepID=A0ABQ9F9X6_TEGGR|nr:hypothetical protein KUTeg_009022 [Tegillarca granosa]
MAMAMEKLKESYNQFKLIRVTNQRSIPYTCPSDWERIGVYCVRVFGTQANKVQTWETAQAMCIGHGGYLAKVDDHLINHELGEYARGKGAQMFWIGMNRKGVSNSDSEKVQWENNMEGTVYEGIWKNKSPDVQNGDCVYVKYMMEHGYVMQFEKCKSKMAYICQRPSCPSGSFFCHNGNCINSNHMCDNYDDCEPNCRRKIQMSSGTISSPSSGGNGFYDSSKVCVWTIIGPEGSNIFINFTRFSTEYRRDMVNILIGGETEATSTSIAQLSGQPDLNTLHFRSYNNFMIVTFSTDSSVTKPGFSANFHIDEGYPPVNNLKATNSPQEFLPQFYYLSSQSVYLGGKDYVWVITATEERKLVTIERLSLDLYKGDTVEIHDGSTPQGKLLAVYSYQNNDNYKPTTTITKPQTGPRFVVSTGCDISISSDVGEIFSPGYLYGINYANYANCSWAVTNAGQMKATLFFNNDMDFEANVDYFKIYKGSVDTSGTAVHTDCPDPGFNANTLRFIVDCLR